MRFSDEFLSEVRDRNDIVDVISPYVDLRVRGALATGLCPFHNEKTPSFTVYINTQSYYCFGCGSGGDAITFIKNIENLDYAEAVTMLAERSGLALPADGYDDGIAKMKRQTTSKMLKSTVGLPQKLLWQSRKPAITRVLWALPWDTPRILRTLTLHLARGFIGISI